MQCNIGAPLMNVSTLTNYNVALPRSHPITIRHVTSDGSEGPLAQTSEALFKLMVIQKTCYFNGILSGHGFIYLLAAQVESEWEPRWPWLL